MPSSSVFSRALIACVGAAVVLLALCPPSEVVHAATTPRIEVKTQGELRKARAQRTVKVARCQAAARAKILPIIEAHQNPKVKAMLRQALTRHVVACARRYPVPVLAKPVPRPTASPTKSPTPTPTKSATPKPTPTPTSTSTASPTQTATPSPGSTEPVNVCTINDPRLPEVSGLTYSIRHSNTLWLHNDSGDSARIFAINATTCAVTAQITLAGVSAYDFEAISTGRDQNGTPVLWIGDTGDNYHQRAYVTLYRIPEPQTLANQTVTPVATRVTYADGPQNAEALLVDPSPGGAVAIVSKESVGRVYSLPQGFSVGSSVTVSAGCQVRPYVTDAAVAPDESRSILRSGNAGSVITSATSCTGARTFSYPSQRQGEAVTFSANGANVYIASEGVGDLVRIPANALPN